jgi:FAD/FMN-containing dehydrogenase
MENLIVVSNTGSKVELPGTVLEEFKANLGGQLITVADPEYDEVRQIWNGMHDKCPALIARCSGVADVIDSVNFARENNILISVRGGGHNVAGSASNDGGIMIDLSLMKGVRVDSENRIVHAQGGVTWGEIDRETQVFGLVAPGGVVSTTGIAGLTLGGGLGWLRKKYGLTIDNLLSVDIVTADGNFLTASEKQNSDLFWAVRGGGGNFGVVTSFEFRLQPVGPIVSLCAPFYPAESAKEILPVWKDFMASSPDEISSNANFWTIPPAPGFPEELHGRRVFIIIAVYSGSVEEGEKLMKPLREIGTPLIDLSGPIPWTALQTMFDPFFPKAEQLYYFKSKYLNIMNEDAIDTIMEKACNPPEPMILIAIWHFGGAIKRVSENETAFSGRQNTYLLSVDAIWSNPSNNDNVISYANDFLADLKPYSSGGIYVNFPGLGEEGESLVKDAYGDNYKRLSELKAKYDPDNIFHNNQNIKP